MCITTICIKIEFPRLSLRCYKILKFAIMTVKIESPRVLHTVHINTNVHLGMWYKTTYVCVHTFLEVCNFGFECCNPFGIIAGDVHHIITKVYASHCQ